jgi:hypothetical protein
MGAEAHLLYSHREVHQAAGEGEQRFAGMAIRFVSLNGVAGLIGSVGELAGKELPAFGNIHADLHSFGDPGLSVLQIPVHLHQIQAEVAVVMARIPQQPTGSATHGHGGWRGLVG